jgi:hypothetical protein
MIKKQILSEEFKRMQELAGIITEMPKIINPASGIKKKIDVIKEWVWYTCDEGQATQDINEYNKMIDKYFAFKDDVTKEDFAKIWNKVLEKYAIDMGADGEFFEETWEDVQNGTLVGK